uniref:Uncharacterized protein n=1 Tax=Trypanosoma vivax (strain Y486) TaxID=1055687 RepID=G0UD65_TRYVY|nr:conserved hypothetical protein, fragment [Trypanosoma vivax Y486]
MDVDVSSLSVRCALGDAQQKIKSLLEDGELYVTLEAKTNANFERHRSELTQLLQKERALHAAVEDRLRAELHGLLSENEAAQSEVRALRIRREERCCEEVRRQQEERRLREVALREELSGLHDALTAVNSELAEAQQERTWHELQLREVLEKQTFLTAELARVRNEAEELLMSGTRPLCEKKFLPSGAPDKSDPTRPASHNIAAILSTVERKNYHWPRLYFRHRGVASPLDSVLASSPRRRCRSRSGSAKSCSTSCRATPPRSVAVVPASILPKTVAAGKAACSSWCSVKPGRSVTYSARHLAAVCRSLMCEILQLRKEYQECTAALKDPKAESIDISRRMRSIMGCLDSKVRQLRSLRQQQANVESKLELHDMMMEIAQENDYCESVYSDLLELIRS